MVWTFADSQCFTILHHVSIALPDPARSHTIDQRSHLTRVRLRTRTHIRIRTSIRNQIRGRIYETLAKHMQENALADWVWGVKDAIQERMQP